MKTRECCSCWMAASKKENPRRKKEKEALKTDNKNSIERYTSLVERAGRQLTIVIKS